MANTHFTQDETVISICGLSSAQADDGRMELLDGFAGCGHRHLFSDGPGQQSGFGRWDNTNKCLFLYLVQETECTTEYVFAFTVHNDPTFQESPDIEIGASFVANSKDVYESGINITSAPMDSPKDPEGCQWVYSEDGAPVCGASAALKIWKFEYLSANISQSTCIPCERNTMAVKFRTNVRVSTVCGSNLTISGLKNAIAPDGKMHISAADGSSTLDIFKSTCGEVGYGTWDNTQKELVLVVNKDIDAGSLVSFTFDLTNPVSAQECPEVTLLTHGLNNEAHSVVMGQGSDCAMRVCASDFTTAYAVQKSSIPCDDNVICVMFALNSTLAMGCSPTLTIIGIPTSTNIDGTSFAARIPEDAFPETFALSTEVTAKRITVTLQGSLAAHTNFTLCFKVINYNCARDQGSPMKLELNTDDSVLVAQANSEYDHCLSRSIAGLPEITSQHSVQIGRLQVKEDQGVLRHLYGRYFSKTPPAELNDILPFFVRANELSLDLMVQSSALPCASNKITTTISATRDVLFRNGQCQPVIAFRLPLCQAGTSLALTDKASVFPDFATAESGSSDWFSIVAQASIMANIDYSFSFTVLNPATPQDAPTISMKLSREQNDCAADDTSTTLVSGSTSSDPLFISDWTLSSLSITESSQIPCSTNTLSVEFMPTVVLHTECQPSITISGLEGTLTTTTPTVQVETGGATVNGLMSVTSWDQTSGTLVLKIDAQLSAAVHTIIFDVTNPSCSHDAQTVTISVGTSRCAAVTKSATLGNVLGTIARSFNPGASVRQSTPYPCAENTITLQFSTSEPLFAACGSAITLTSLTGSLTADDSDLEVQWSQSTTQGDWTQTSGTLIVSVPDTEADVEYSVSFKLQNPTKRVSCPTVTLTHQCGATETDSQEIAIISQVPAYSDLSQPTDDDYKPLCIREPVICITGIAESQPYECAETTISVTLTSNVPLKTACVQNQALTVSGIIGMLTTFDSNSFSMSSGSSTISGTTGVWDAASGSMTVSLGGDMDAEVDHVLTWILLHNNSTIPTRVVTMSGTAVSSLAPEDTVAMGTGCQAILHMVPKLWHINLTQSPPLACTTNLVSICISTSIPLWCVDVHTHGCVFVCVSLSLSVIRLIS